jgi:hypothetical protein
VNSTMIKVIFELEVRQRKLNAIIHPTSAVTNFLSLYLFKFISQILSNNNFFQNINYKQIQCFELNFFI